MPWQSPSVTEQRLRFVVLASREDACMTQLCREFGIQRSTGYLWLQRYRQGGMEQIVERSRRPLHSPTRTVACIEEAVVSLRRQWPDWGAPKLAHVYAQQHPEQAPLCVRTVHRILRRHQLITEPPRPAPALQRFERAAPNELWQMDFKGPQGFNRGSPVGPLSILDDHSRYLVALEHLGSTRGSGVQAALTRTFHHAGMPQALLVDHGVPWWSTGSPWGLSELTVWIMRHGVRVLFSGLRHPQTQGKVERMHGALQRAVRQRRQNPEQQDWLDVFRHEYNHVRPHAGIAMGTPASRWHPSPRRFQEPPAEWEYAAAQTVLRLDHRGQLRWRHRCYPVSQALRGQRVGVESLGDRALVFFCRTPLRELDFATGRSIPVPLDAHASLQR